MQAAVATEDDKVFMKFSQAEIEEMKAIFEGGNLKAVAKKLQELETEKIPLHITSTGEAGSRKSTSVNAIRGLGDEDAGATETWVVETTMDLEPYSHPTLPNVTIWDLPGIGTPRFKPDQYLKQMSFKKYDIIITASRFGAHHTQLTKEIQKLGKKFYYVRSKVDADLDAAEKCRPRTYNEEGILEEIRNNCNKNLKKAGGPSPWVFLISSWKPAKYDFQLLLKILEKEMDEHKRQIFILALPNISAQILEKKRAELERQIWKEALVLRAISAVPLPGLSFAVDITRLMVNMKHYCQAFGLDEDALCSLTQQVGKPVEELKSEIKMVPTASSINKEYVTSLLKSYAYLSVMVVVEVLHFIPGAGSLVSGGILFGTTYYMLNKFLSGAAKDAHRVLTKALS
ncbi:PREDICTED: LOW QUALITY PROTEIN: interferon-inducible GTPase 5-like [Gavialis gangeticus]|uniref:LOW QUALITY PROTEIN: interferon-inducible GTPase 5-like n=1 Tax=Gavialis gangeticus TaxID=94835 RepID=UPI00092F926F|nr:PREDICTED: LOW QUALITY PROTEIN: interferon-inducible GTPase 5-like [Gavialis gangeticus]